VLARVGRSGAELQRVGEKYLADPDVVLAAAAQQPELLRGAPPQLRADPGFALEAVARNWRALEHLEGDLRADRAVVLAACRQSEEAQRLAQGRARTDRSIVAEARALGRAAPWLRAYEGEGLRLVGCCNEWRTTDALLRFRRVRLGPTSGWSGIQVRRSGGVDAGNAARPKAASRGPMLQDVRRHQLTVHLRQGCLSFQVLSCTQGYDFRIFPVNCDRTGYFTLKDGDPSAVEAAVGGEEDGHHRNFHIEEAKGAVVSIYVELLCGLAESWAPPGPAFWQLGVDAGASRRAAVVWYVLEGQAREAVAVSITEFPDRERPFDERSAKGVDPAAYRIMEDVDVRKEDFEDVVWQALSLSKKTFDIDQAEMLELLSDDTHLTLLVDRTGQTTVGYCQYFLYTSKGDLFLWVEFLLVAEELRGKNLGKLLMRWAAAHAEDAGCRAIRLNSRDPKLPWYRALGFELTGRQTDKGLWPMELLLPRRPWARG